jgi:DNA cross-link repair 1C protein
MLTALCMSPLVQRYLAPAFSFGDGGNRLMRRLDAIFLDTACMLQMHRVPSKVCDGPAVNDVYILMPPQADAMNGMVQLMALFPGDTRFFLNSWTWGYEDMLKAVASAFGCQVRSFLS